MVFTLIQTLTYPVQYLLGAVVIMTYNPLGKEGVKDPTFLFYGITFYLIIVFISIIMSVIFRLFKLYKAALFAICLPFVFLTLLFFLKAFLDIAAIIQLKFFHGGIFF